MTCSNEYDSFLLTSKDTGVSNPETFSVSDEPYSPNGSEKDELFQ
jgi:hypothetical protein